MKNPSFSNSATADAGRKDVNRVVKYDTEIDSLAPHHVASAGGVPSGFLETYPVPSKGHKHVHAGMKRILYVFLLIVIAPIVLLAQSGKDQVLLKDGRTLKGTIVEEGLTDYMKLRLENGVVAEIPVEDIAHIARNGEKMIEKTEIQLKDSLQDLMIYSQAEKNPSTAVLWSILLPSAGHAYAGNWGRGLIFTAGEIGFLLLASEGIEKISHTYTNYVDWGWPFKPWEYTTTKVEIVYHDLYWIGLTGMVVLKLWEIIDASGEADRYNTELRKMLSNILSDNNINFHVSKGYAGNVNLGLQIGF
jgi:hypothetical protein